MYTCLGALLGYNLTDVDEIHSQRENLIYSSLEQTLNYVCCVCARLFVQLCMCASSVCVCVCTCVRACLCTYTLTVVLCASLLPSQCVYFAYA